RPLRYDIGHKRAVACAARDDDAVTFTGFVHECEGVPLAFENVNCVARNQFTDDERTRFYALWEVEPRAVFLPVMNGDDISRSIMYRKRDTAIVQPDKPLFVQP